MSKPIRKHADTHNCITNLPNLDGCKPQNHVIIAGTGRAGTSFLVRYLTELGLDTHLSRPAAEVFWDENANAGLEDMPIGTVPDQLPYVIKSPWIGEFIDQLLAQKALTINVAIIPVRDLLEASVSRIINEMRSIQQNAPWMTEFTSTWDVWGFTPGGVVLSLNPVDQARVLAAGFHRLVQRLVDADVPILFLAFPKLVTDWEYLFRKLRPYLAPHISAEDAQAAHQRTADIEKVRVGAELRSSQSALPAALTIAARTEYPNHRQLDQIATRREVKRLNLEVDRLKVALQQSELEARQVQERAVKESAELRAVLERQQIKAQKLQTILNMISASRWWPLRNKLK